MSIAPSKHFRLSPSGSKRWLLCPGSARDDLPQTQTAAATDGHDAHAMASFGLEHGLPVFGDSDKPAAVRTYIDFVQAQAGTKLYERTLVSEIVPDFGGTIDALIVTPESLHVVDFKSGRWKVPAKNNPQLASYLCLARETYDRDQFTATIIQPAVYAKPNTAEFTAKQLDTHIAKVAMASTQTDVYLAGEQCRFCPLLPQCEIGQDWGARQSWRAGLDPK